MLKKEGKTKKSLGHLLISPWHVALPKPNIRYPIAIRHMKLFCKNLGIIKLACALIPYVTFGGATRAAHQLLAAEEYDDLFGF